MGRSGIGLKPLIAVYLVTLLGAGAVLVSVAAVRIARHAMVSERVWGARAVLREMGPALASVCREQDQPGGVCPGLSAWVRRHAGLQPDLRAVSILDPAGRVRASSDPAQGARGMWDALGQRPAAVLGGQGWWVIEEVGERVLVVETRSSGTAPGLRGAFSLAETDLSASRLATSVAVYGTLVALVLLVIGWLLLYRLVVRPVERLLQMADRVSEQGDLSWLLSADRGSEYGRLGLRLGRMGRRIEEDQNRLRRQIGELEQLNRDLHQAQQAMLRQEKLASVGLLAAGLAHEVGNPMSAIVGYVGMLRTEQFPDDERADILARVERELERIDKILQDLLAFSRPSRGEVRACTPAELVADASALIRPQKQFKGISFETDLAEDLPAVACDPDLVCQVLVNLMLNALDALDDGGRLWVRAAQVQRGPDGGLVWGAAAEEPAFFALGELHRIRPPRDGRGLPDGPAVIFTVADDGDGIAPADLARIFDPFFTTKQPGKGTGLGLAICHTAIGTLGGEIWAWSSPGVGTQFAFWLPVAEERS